MTLNQTQFKMLVKALEEFKRINPDIEVNYDYKRLEREIEPFNRQFKKHDNN
jgi:hypothetical protein